MASAVPPDNLESGDHGLVRSVGSFHYSVALWFVNCIPERKFKQ